MLGRGVGAFLVLVCASACATAPRSPGLQRHALRAFEPGGFDSDLTTDILSSAGMLAVGLLADREKHSWSEVSPCEGARHSPSQEERAAFAALGPGEGTCDVSRVPSVDRVVTRLKWDPARRLSDLGLLGLLAVPFGVAAVHTGVQQVPASAFAVDSVVITQTLSATLVTTALLKMMVARARPLTYNPDFSASTRFSGDARLSFPSGHSSMAFSAASLTAVMLLKRYPGHVGAYLGTASAYLAASSVATLRVLAGKHFITDVIAGAALGTVIGLVIPLSHVNEGETDGAELGHNRASAPVFSFGGSF